MQITDILLQPAFKRAATYGSLAGALLLSGCASMTPPPQSCMGGQRVSLMGFGIGGSKFDEDCAKYQLQRMDKQATLDRAAALLAKDDPLSQAMGNAIYDELDAEGRKAIDKRVAAALAAQPARTVTKCLRTVKNGEVVLDCPAAPATPKP